MEVDIYGNILDAEPTTVKSAKQLEVLKKGLDYKRWEIIDNGKVENKFSLTTNKGELVKKILINMRSVGNGGRSSRPKEKRIQLAETLTFKELLSENEVELLLGLYKNGENEIICAWNIEDNRDHGSSKSCFIDIDTLKEATLNGMATYEFVSSKKKCKAIAFQPEFLHYYINNMKNLHEILEEQIQIEENTLKDIEIKLEFPEKPLNRILYGAPGTGKSYKFYDELKDYPPEQIERVTFYSDYTYGKFIGMFKPTSGADYTYQEGPFLRILRKALENPELPYFLIVEEINRTDTASTFGDIFQLLDRNDDGKSSYEIDISEDMKSYFEKGNLLKNNKLYIPSNLYIWATMNSADQGVYPLDSAFKRRWSMEYVDINNGKEKRESLEIKFTTYKPIHWNTLREKLNDIMDSKGIREDKQLGVFFLKVGADEKGEFNEEGFKNKLLMYLSEDVFRHQKREVFKKNTYGKILTDFKKGKDIFVSGEKEFDELNSLFEKV